MKKIFLIITTGILTFFVSAENYPYRSNVLWVTTPDHDNWLYKINEKASVTVSVYEFGILQNNIEVSYSIGPELMPGEKSGNVILKDGKAEIPLGTMKAPGFLDCRLETTIGGRIYKHHIKVGFEPDKLKPYTKLPEDFVTFWDQAKQEAAECPLMAERRFVPEFSSDKVNCYLVKLQVYKKDHYVYGYLTVPKKEGTFPLVFSPPGAGIKPMDPLKHMFYAEEGFIRFDMEIHGIRPDLDADTYKEISRAFGKDNNSYLVNGLDNRDSYYMKKVYMACIGALDYLTSLPEWDGKNLIAQGGSQGGALALITAGLDKRITACAANHPALSDMIAYKYGRAGGYPHLFTKFTGMDTPDKIRTLTYYDVVNFVRYINVPVFMTWGYNDNTCPPTTSYCVYNSINSAKEALITPVNEHWVSTETRHVILKWIRDNLK
ncbi:acetylxylan esterase [Saccharicrinis sp. FJH54]|uniref:acetylxylan esterase n=1 Tax=Saccharicrinis sp. FJH54 TaxID=3344665 RepID=UPI0035D48DD6